MKNAGHQAQDRFQLRALQNLEITRERLQHRESLRRSQARERTSISLTLGVNTLERARRSCEAKYGVSLETYFRTLVQTFADSAPPNQRTAAVLSTAEDNALEWKTLILESTADMPAGTKLTMQELFNELGDRIPAAAQDRGMAITIGHIMKRLRWAKKYLPTIEGDRRWFYVKPDDPAPRALEPIERTYKRPKPDPKQAARLADEKAQRAAERQKRWAEMLATLEPSPPNYKP